MLFLALNLLLAFLVGGCWVTLATFAADRLGSRIGGFIGGLPSTVVVTFLFIALSQTPQIASQATTVFPLFEGITGLFLVVYAALAKRGFAFSITCALLVWFVLSSLIIAIKTNSFVISILGYLLVVLLSYCFLKKHLKIQEMKGTKIRFSGLQILMRALFGGAVIALAVFLSKIGGPIFGGAFAAFPAVFFSTLAISYMSRGPEFSRSMTKPLFTTGMVAIVAYGIAVRYLYLTTGLFFGTVAAYLVSAVSAYVVFELQKHKIRL